MIFAMQHRKDPFKALEAKYPDKAILISDGVVRELEGIAVGKGKKAAAARSCIEILKLKNVKVDNINSNVDRWVLARAQRGDVYCVVTNDTELFRRLHSAKIAAFKLSKNGLLK